MIIQNLQNIHVDSKIDAFAQLCPPSLSDNYSFVVILENGHHFGQFDSIDLIEMAHTNVGACITICAVHPTNKHPICSIVTVLQPTPREMLQHAPCGRFRSRNVLLYKIRCTLYPVTDVHSSVCTHNYEHAYPLCLYPNCYLTVGLKRLNWHV